ncbi:hypothetical protein ACQE98_01790 [Ornithinimicrobium sp. W1679]|uniref:hypothetical protein n=1 Tax=unclassified Ornithinimicrobium TaxID=2615080 RepID=UPI003CF85A46
MSTTQETDVPVAHAPARDLVVSYCFPPYADTSSIVAAKRVRERGRPVDVLSNAMAGFRPTDPTLEQIAGDLVRRRSEVASPTHFASWSSMSRFSALGIQQALAWDREGDGYERLYSRAQFAASHVLAARFVIVRPEVRWTAEFSDPLSHAVDGSVRRSTAGDGALLRRFGERIRAAGFEPPATGNSFDWAEHVAYALADEILFTNERQLELMAAAIPDRALAARVLRTAVVSPHPTLPPSFYSIATPGYELEPGVRHLAYFGNFYASRDLDTVLDGLGALPLHLRDRLRLHTFAGDRAALHARIEAGGLGPWVRTHPFVGYLEFLALSRAMDVLVVNDAVTSGQLAVNPYLPSKWSDYRGSGTPVWGLVEAGSPLSGQPLDHRSPVGHTTAAAQVLARIACA